VEAKRLSRHCSIGSRSKRSPTLANKAATIPAEKLMLKTFRIPIALPISDDINQRNSSQSESAQREIDPRLPTRVLMALANLDANTTKIAFKIPRPKPTFKVASVPHRAISRGLLNTPTVAPRAKTQRSPPKAANCRANGLPNSYSTARRVCLFPIHRESCPHDSSRGTHEPTFSSGLR
jgi:hypothetical protein